MQSCASGSFVCAYDFSNKQNIIREIEVLNDGGNFKVMFDRVSLIQIVIKKIEAKVYLEIGVFKGYSFLKTICKNKIGIDPCFKIKKIKKIYSYFTNITNINNKYFTMTSDVFFINYKNTLISSPPEVIFIDGLHTFEQTLQDCYNSLNYLAEGGVIILHDCNPPSESSATPALSILEAEQIWKSQYNSGWTDEWCGDSWKTIPYLINNNPELNVSVLNADFGLGLVSKKKNVAQKFYQFPDDIQEYKGLQYSYLKTDKQIILNLRGVEELEAIIDIHLNK